MISILVLLIAAIASISALIATYLAIIERDLLVAILYSAVQSVMFALLYYLLLSPDIVLVYVPVAVGLYPLLMILLIKKTERYEKP